MPSDLAFFILGAFIAALAAGLAGFAFGLIASGLWLHVLAPAQAVPLIAACGLAIHIFSIWRFRSALRWRALWPFLLGGIIGIPLGTLALQHAEPAAFRIGVGLFLVAYSGFMLLRPPMPALAVGGRIADGCVGADMGVAEIGEMLRLCAGLDFGRPAARILSGRFTLHHVRRSRRRPQLDLDRGRRFFQ